MELFKIFGTIALNGGDEVKNELADIGGTATKQSNTMISAFKKIAGAIGIGFGVGQIVNFGKSVISTTQSFSDAMLKVQSLSGASADELQKLNDTALDYGSKTAWTSSQVADAMGYMALAGFDTNEIMESLGGTLSLASASGTDLARASDILTDSLTAFGYSAKDANLFANVLSTTQAKSNTTVEMLGEAFKYVGTLAGSYKYSIEDVSTALGLMANSGIKGSMAGTSLASIITRLATNTNGATDMLKEMGIEFYNNDGTARDLGAVITDLCKVTEGMTASEKASIASKIAGQEAQKGLLAILNQGSDVYDDLNSKLKECDNSANEMANTMESGMGGAMRSMQSAWEGFKIKLGQKIEPYITQVLQDMATFVNEKLVPAMDDLINTIANVIDWFKEHKAIVDTVIGALELLTVTMIAFKVGAEIQGVINMWQEAQVALALYSLETNGATLAQGFLNGELTIGQLAVGLLTGQMTLAEFATALWTKAQWALNVAMDANPVGAVIALIVALIGIGILLYKKCDFFKKFIDGFWKGLVDDVKKVVDFFKNNWQTILLFLVNPFWGGFKLLYDKCDKFREFVNNFVEKIKNAFSKVVDFFKNNWKTILLFMVNPFAGAFKILYDKCDKFREFWDNLINKIKNAWNKCVDFIKNGFKLPHFSFSGSLNPAEWAKGNKPKIDVEWYAKGGVMTEPTLFGVNPRTGNPMVGGEDGAEAIAPISTLQSYVKDAVSSETKVITSTMTKLLTLLSNVLPDIRDNMDKPIVLDTGQLVGGTADKMDAKLGSMATSKARFGV